MELLNNERAEKIRDYLLKMLYGNRLNQIMGIEIMELDEERGLARMKYAENVLNFYGTVHGGAILSMADTVAGTTACMCGDFMTTVSCNLNFLMAAKDTEYIYCESKRLKCGRNLCVYEVKITDDKGNLLDSGEYSFFRSSNPILREE